MMSDRRGVTAATIAMLGWASSGIIVKAIPDIGAFAIVFWRMWMYTAIVLLFLAIRGTPLRLSSIRVSLAGGISLGIDLVLFYAAVRLTTVANATVIAACLPIVMLIAGGPLFGERSRLRDWVVAAIGLSGVVLVSYGSSGLPAWSPAGDLLAVGALFAWALYFIFSKLSQSKIDSFQYTAGTALIAAVLSIPFAVVSGEIFVMPSNTSWLWLVLLAAGPGFASHMLMNWSLTRVTAAFAATLNLGIPIVATIMAWLWLGEAIVTLQALGICVTIAALTFLVLRNPETETTSQEYI